MDKFQATGLTSNWIKGWVLVKRIILAATILGTLAIPSEKVQAGGNAGKAIAGAAVVGSIIWLMTHNKKNDGRKKVRHQASQMSVAQREQNKDVQRSLNYFDYPVGGVDGSLGRKSKNAIRNFQADMGFPVDGKLNDNERNFLTGSYQRTQPYTQGQDGQILAQQGPRGLLQHYRNQQLAAYNQDQNGYNNPYQAQPEPIDNGQIQQSDYTDNPQSQVVTNNDVPTLPSFMPAQQVSSMATDCQATHMLTVTNGGLMNASDVTNPSQALNEQFCMARQYTMAEGKSIASTIGGVAPEQYQAQCQGLADILSSAIDTAPNQTVDAVLATATQAIATAGGTPAGLVPTSKVCLSVGYQVDKPRISAASAILLVAAGQASYGEIVGHQLREGFGFAANPERAKEWYLLSIDAMDRGATPTILPNEARARNAVIRTAIGQGTLQAGLFASGGNPSDVVDATNASLTQSLPAE